MCFPVAHICQMLLLWEEGLILEVSCSFDDYMEQALADKLLKYQPLAACLDSLGSRCKLVALIFGSLGLCTQKLGQSGWLGTALFQLSWAA